MLASATVLVAAACNESRDTGAVTSRTASGTSNAPSAEAVEDRDMALVRVINAIPGGAPINIWAGDSAAFTAVAYSSTTPYREIPDNLFNFEIKNAADAEPLAENRENLKDGGHYTIVALPDEGGADKRNLRVLDDELKPVSPDKARVRFINGVPGDHDVDLVLLGRDEPLFDGVDFKTEAGWKEFAPAAGTIEARPDNGKTAIASLPDVKLEGGRTYTFVLSGNKLIKVEDSVAEEHR
jgi:hypothetical protein